MRYASLVFLALSVLLAGEVQADSIKTMIATIQQPITIKAGKTSPRMDVVFNHSSHKGLSCFTCHHKVSAEKGRYISCKSCHTTPGRSKEPMSMFMAFHAKNSKHSCIACHNRMAEENPKLYGKAFYNCRPCHRPPQKNASK